MTDRPDRRPYRQCQAIMPAQINRGVPWTTEHRCRHPAGPSGYCWQHRPPEQSDELLADQDELSAERS